MEIRRITEKHARHSDGCGRCTERRDRDTELEPTHKLFQHENRARHGCVEGSGKAGTRTGGKQHPTIWPLTAEDFSDKVGNARCVGGESADQPGRNQGRGSTSRHKEQKSCKLFALCPGNHRITQTVRLFKRKPEDRSHKSRRRADDERQ